MADSPKPREPAKAPPKPAPRAAPVGHSSAAAAKSATAAARPTSATKAPAPTAKAPAPTAKHPAPTAKHPAPSAKPTQPAGKPVPAGKPIGKAAPPRPAPRSGSAPPARPPARASGQPQAQKARPASGTKPRPAAQGAPPIKASAANIPPKPRAPEGRHGEELSQTFTAARQLLDDVLGEQNQRIVELQVGATSGLKEALSRFQDASRFVRNLLERNELMAREAQRLTEEGKHLGGQQNDLEADLKRLASHNHALADRVNQLRRERNRLQAETTTLEDAARDDGDALGRQLTAFERASAGKQKVQAEVERLARDRKQLDDDLIHLQRLREDYLTQVRSAKRALSELTNE